MTDRMFLSLLWALQRLLALQTRLTRSRTTDEVEPVLLPH